MHGCIIFYEVHPEDIIPFVLPDAIRVGLYLNPTGLGSGMGRAGYQF
jgi:hypothetical protein